MLSCSATNAATSLRSPVSITVFSMPAFFNAAIADAASAFIWSDITMCPAYSPSNATYIVVPLRCWHFSQVAIIAPIDSIIFALPTHTFLPLISAKMPCPATSFVFSILHSHDVSLWALRSAAAMGWLEYCSTWAARCKSSCSESSFG